MLCKEKDLLGYFGDIPYRGELTNQSPILLVTSGHPHNTPLTKRKDSLRADKIENKCWVVRARSLLSRFCVQSASASGTWCCAVVVGL